MSYKFTVNTVLDILVYSFMKLDHSSDGHDFSSAIAEEFEGREWPVSYSLGTMFDIVLQRTDGERMCL